MSEKNDISVGAKIKNSSLNLAGMGYLIGDAALFTHGLAHNDYSRAFTGLSWGVGGLSTALYGKESAEHQLSRISQELGRYLKANNIEIPKNSALQREFLNKHSSIWNRLEGFLYQYPSQILNATYAIGGASLIKSGLTTVKETGKRNPWIAASGALVTTGALLGLMLSEKEDITDNSKPAVRFTENPIDWFNEKPLRWSSAFYTANNATLVKGALEEKVKHPTSNRHQLLYLAVAAYLSSNTMLGLSSKDHATQSGAQVSAEQLEQLATEIIAAQPKEVQEHLTQQVAAHLATHKEVNAEAGELAHAITQKVDTRVELARLKGRVEDSEKVIL